MRCFTTLMLSAVVTGEIIYPKVLGNPALGHEGIKMLKIYMGKVTLSYHYGAFGLCTEDYDANGVKNGYSKLTLNDRQIYKQKYSDRCSTPVGRAELTNTELQLDSGDPYRMLQYIQKINNGGYDFKEYASGDCHPSLAIKATDVKKKVSSGPSLLPLHPIGICTKSEIDSFGLARDGTICIEKRRFTNPSCSGTPSNTRLKLYNTCFAKEGSSYADFITFTGFTPDDLKEALCMRALIDKTFSPSGTCGDIPAADTAELCKEIGLNIHEVTHSPPTGSGSGSSTSVAATLFVCIFMFRCTCDLQNNNKQKK